jgi:hypothetical protein
MRRSILTMVLISISVPMLPGDERDRKVDPAFAAWYYPGATANSTSEFAGKLHQVLMMTPDDVKKIENFYYKQTHNPLADVLIKGTDPKPFGLHTTQGYPHPKDDKKQVVVMWGDDSKVRTDGEARGVTLRTLVYDTEDELVTVTISHTPSEKTSHIVLTCVKKK